MEICHLDLKLENILIDKNMNIKVADFGFAEYTDKPLELFVGTKHYQAPEILLED